MGNKHEEQRGEHIRKWRQDAKKKCSLCGFIGEHDRFWGTRLSSRQSGKSKTEGHMSKRGAPYLRRSVWLSAIVAAFKDPAVSLFY